MRRGVWKISRSKKSNGVEEGRKVGKKEKNSNHGVKEDD